MYLITNNRKIMNTKEQKYSKSKRVMNLYIINCKLSKVISIEISGNINLKEKSYYLRYYTGVDLRVKIKLLIILYCLIISMQILFNFLFHQNGTIL